MLCRLTIRPGRSPSTRSHTNLRRPMLLLTLVPLTVWGMATFCMQRYFVVNFSPSLPLGLYRRVPDEPGRGRLAEFSLSVEAPSRLRHAFAQRVLKPIVAGQGDYVDTSGDSLLINGHRVAPIHTTDSAGHALPVWRASRRLQEGEFFTYSARVPNSFDSRYYGPVQHRNITSVYVPLWTWGEAVELNETSAVPGIAAE